MRLGQSGIEDTSLDYKAAQGVEFGKAITAAFQVGDFCRWLGKASTYACITKMKEGTVEVMKFAPHPKSGSCTCPGHAPGQCWRPKVDRHHVLKREGLRRAQSLLPRLVSGTVMLTAPTLSVNARCMCPVQLRSRLTHRHFFP